jgi:hypothetical protein
VDIRTDCDRLDLHTIFKVGYSWVVRVLVLEDLLSAEGVYERRAACKLLVRSVVGLMTRAAFGALSPVPEAPQTIKQN